MSWDSVRTALELGAVGITWDGCHKIYVAMDEGAAQWLRDCEYDVEPVTADEASVEKTLATLGDWWNGSCGLRLLSAIKSKDGEVTNDGFTDLLRQFEEA